MQWRSKPHFGRLRAYLFFYTATRLAWSVSAQSSCLPTSAVGEELATSVPGGATFVMCCQTQIPEDAQASEVCGNNEWNCTDVGNCQSSAVASDASESIAVRQPGRAKVSLREMRTFFEMLIVPYLTQSDTDPVFLDAEHVLLSLLLVLAADAVANDQEADQGIFVFDVGAFAGHFGMTALALWDEIGESAAHWPKEVLPAKTEVAAFAVSPVAEGSGKVSPHSRSIMLKPAKVVAFEPSSKLCGEMKRGTWSTTRSSSSGEFHVAALDPARFEVVCAAAMANAGEALLHCPGGSASSVGYMSDHVKSDGCLPPEPINVVALDAFAAERDIRNIGVLKIDAEGNDFEVLRGAEGLLRAHRIRFVIFEAAELSGQSADSTYREQLSLALEFLRAAGGYDCFMLAPEALVPLSPPWLNDVYTVHQHTFNALCARRIDPLLPSVIRLYSVNPRATQFALAALPRPAGRMLSEEKIRAIRLALTSEGESTPTDFDSPECWACEDAALSDSVLRRTANSAEQYAKLVYGRALDKGWQLPHFLFMYARFLQSSGDATGALELYSKAQGSTWAAAFEATREVHRFRGKRTAKFLAAVRSAGLLSNSSWEKRHQVGADYALQLGWIHQRPGSGASFGWHHACAAKAWFRLAARAGSAMGAFYAGLTAHYGHCSGVMNAKGVLEAGQWYKHAMKEPNALFMLARNTLADVSLHDSAG